MSQINDAGAGNCLSSAAGRNQLIRGLGRSAEPRWKRDDFFLHSLPPRAFRGGAPLARSFWLPGPAISFRFIALTHWIAGMGDALLFAEIELVLSSASG